MLPKTATAGAAAKPSAILAAEQAASAARAAASAAEARAAAMEKNIEALRQEAKANRESLARLTQALQEAKGESSTPISLWGALAGLGLLSALLALRLRQQQSGSRQVPWWSAGRAAAPETTPTETPRPAEAASDLPALQELPDPRRGGPEANAPGAAFAEPAPQVSVPGFGAGYAPPSRDLPPLPEPEEMDSPESEMERTQLLPPSASSVSAPIQGVSIEELLDLEQQVEFFTVLGQDDAALGLLVEHLRSTGGTYPLPYLKLLEIYRRKGDEESYERTRDRFNQRFNAVAPAWGASPARDRHLEDLPEVLRRIEQVWPRPVDAMALLENMLVRTEGGTLLEMSALGEVLFLFTLARDLHEQEAGAAGPVDVLLPLDDLFDVSASPPAEALQDAATQFAASSFLALAADDAPGAAAPVFSPTPSPAVPEEMDHFDLPLGEPMFEPVFDPPEPSAATPDRSPAGLDAELPPLPASIDLPVFGESEPQNSAYEVPGADSPSQPLGLDLSFDDELSPGLNEPSGSSPALVEPISFDLPDLQAIQAPMPAAPVSTTAVDLDFSLDGLELEPVPPKLSPSQEQAASNFGLFNETPTPGKPR